MAFFLNKNIPIPNVAEKNILIFLFLSYNLMLKSGKNKYSNSRVVRKKILNETS
jgi:hypothetical protein